MDINIKEQQDKLKGEIAQITGEVQAINNQIQQLQQAGQVKINDLLKKQGALELLQSLEE